MKIHLYGHVREREGSDQSRGFDMGSLQYLAQTSTLDFFTQLSSTRNIWNCRTRVAEHCIGEV